MGDFTVLSVVLAVFVDGVHAFEEVHHGIAFVRVSHCSFSLPQVFLCAPAPRSPQRCAVLVLSLVFLAGLDSQPQLSSSDQIGYFI